MSNKHKKPKAEFNPGPLTKQPKGGERVQVINDLQFQWRSKSIDRTGTWGFQELTCEQVWHEIVPKLHDFESMTWSEIINDRRTSNHSMPVDVLSREAIQRLKDIGRENVDTLFQLGLKGKVRLWGTKDGAIFNLLWYDPDHTVYPVGKRNT